MSSSYMCLLKFYNFADLLLSVLLQGSDNHGSAHQHFTTVCYNLRKPLESLVQEDQPDALRGMVVFLSLHASKVKTSSWSLLAPDHLG